MGLNLLKNIELEMGRMKTLRYRERIIDLDILLYDNLSISFNKLIISNKDKNSVNLEDLKSPF